MKKSHLGIYGIIEHNDSILVIKKSRGPYTGMFDFPGGRPEHGESIMDTLVREVLEETGVKVLSAMPYHNAAFCVEYTDQDSPVSLHHIALIYKVTEFDLSGFEQLHEEDAAGSLWISKSELKNFPLSKVIQCVF
jgi:ADP-ribose pyrophosphatase YjhB (NUDIX family)